jgi:regulator of sirC expression with transglutaminase-like and TPR domain
MNDHRARLIDLSDVGALRDDEIDLGRTCLRVAMFEYPRLDVDACVAEIDRLAERSEALARSLDGGALRGVDAALFAEAGFRGNAERYYDPRNSFLNDVLRRRLGIPITLSIVYIEVARRAGLAVDGVAFPGHFFVAHRTAERTEYIDAFAGGTRLDLAARRRLARAVLPDGDVPPRLLTPPSRRSIVVRMLRNLHGIYAKAGDHGRVVATLDRILQVAPDEVEPLRERSAARLRLGDLAGALEDVDSYLARASGDANHESARELLGEVRRALAARN